MKTSEFKQCGKQNKRKDIAFQKGSWKPTLRSIQGFEVGMNLDISEETSKGQL